MWVFWLILAFIAFLAEILTPGTLISFWFCIGALITAPLSLWISQFLVQCLIFGVISVLAMTLCRPFLQKMLIKEHVPTNTDRYIGQRAKVLATRANDPVCTVLLNGQEWSALEEESRPLLPGDSVLIRDIQGVKLIVRKEYNI